MSDALRRAWPVQTDELDDDQLVAELCAEPNILRVNFVASVNGATTHDGRSDGLSGDADKRFFELLRRVCDVVMVGAGTVRVEGYGPMRVSEGSTEWRLANGRSAHPGFAIVSRRLDLDPESDIFAEAPTRPIILTIAGSPKPRREELEKVADVVIAGDQELDFVSARRQLEERGLNSILCEGGPQLFSSMLKDSAVDELRLTVAHSLEVGPPLRITDAMLQEPMPVRLDGLLVAEDALLLSYRF